MTRAHKIEALLSLIGALLLTFGTLALIRWEKQQPIALRGAVIVQDTDPRKQLPIGGVEISAEDPSNSTTKSDSSGFFLGLACPSQSAGDVRSSCTFTIRCIVPLTCTITLATSSILSILSRSTTVTFQRINPRQSVECARPVHRERRDRAQRG